MDNVMTKLKNKIQKTEKKEVKGDNERTEQLKYYTPDADIYENENRIRLDLNVPGVSSDRVDVHLEGSTLIIDAKIDIGEYDQLNPVYTEYNVGHFSRKFELSENIDTEKIDATVKNGVLTIDLPKKPKAQPRKIEVK